jgi:hypothetical protein
MRCSTSEWSTNVGEERLSCRRDRELQGRSLEPGSAVFDVECLVREELAEEVEDVRPERR